MSSSLTFPRSWQDRSGCTNTSDPTLIFHSRMGGCEPLGAFPCSVPRALCNMGPALHPTLTCPAGQVCSGRVFDGQRCPRSPPHVLCVFMCTHLTHVHTFTHTCVHHGPAYSSVHAFHSYLYKCSCTRGTCPTMGAHELHSAYAHSRNSPWLPLVCCHSTLCLQKSHRSVGYSLLPSHPLQGAPYWRQEFPELHLSAVGDIHPFHLSPSHGTRQIRGQRQSTWSTGPGVGGWDF